MSNTQFRAAGKRGEIWLYDQIGDSFWGEGISAKTFQRELSALGKVDEISLRINSPGGDVFDGLAIYNQLKTHPARVVVDVDGLCASIASVIAMAGDDIRMASNAMMMIHNPHGMAVGDAAEMQRVAALLDQVKGALVDTYAGRTGRSRSDLQAWMDDETWLSAEDAVQHGFADAVTGAQKVSAHFDLLRNYRKVPGRLKASDARPLRDIASVRAADMERRIKALQPA